MPDFNMDYKATERKQNVLPKTYCSGLLIIYSSKCKKTPQNLLLLLKTRRQDFCHTDALSTPRGKPHSHHV